MNKEPRDIRYVEAGKRLKEELLKIYASVGEASAALGMSPQSLSQYLSGKRMPGNKVLKRIKELGIDTVYVTTGRKDLIKFNNYKESYTTFDLSSNTNDTDPEIVLLKKLYEEKVVQGEAYRREIAELKLKIVELERLIGQQKAPKTYHGAKHVSEFDLEDEVGPSRIKVEPEKPIHIVPMMQVAATPIMEINGETDDRSEYDRL